MTITMTDVLTTLLDGVRHLLSQAVAAIRPRRARPWQPRRPRVYIAGPYTQGDVAQNVRAAVMAADRIASLGGVPFCPHLTHLWHIISPHAYEFWLRQDLAWLAACDALVRLPGPSAGADGEVAAARWRGLPVFEAAVSLTTGRPTDDYATWIDGRGAYDLATWLQEWDV